MHLVGRQGYRMEWEWKPQQMKHLDVLYLFLYTCMIIFFLICNSKACPCFVCEQLSPYVEGI